MRRDRDPELLVGDANFDQAVETLKDVARSDIPKWARLAKLVNNPGSRPFEAEDMDLILKLAGLGMQLVTGRLLGRKV